MDDNARLHRGWFSEQRFDHMEWPAYSPDMNPIEHAWDRLKTTIRACPNAAVTVKDLTAKATQIWSEMSQDTIDKLIESMPRRVEALIESRGGVTRY